MTPEFNPKMLFVRHGEHRFDAVDSVHHYQTTFESVYGTMHPLLRNLLSAHRGPQYLLTTLSEDTLFADFEKHRCAEIGVHYIKFVERPSSRMANIVVEYLHVNRLPLMLYLDEGTRELPL